MLVFVAGCCQDARSTEQANKLAKHATYCYRLLPGSRLLFRQIKRKVGDLVNAEMEKVIKDPGAAGGSEKEPIEIQRELPNFNNSSKHGIS